GSAAGMEVVRRAGAGQVLDHSTPGYLDELAGITGGRGVSVVVEMLADVNLEHDLGVLAAGGRVVVVGSRGSLEFTPRLTMIKEATVMGTALWNASEAETAGALAGLRAKLGSGARVPGAGGGGRARAPGCRPSCAAAPSCRWSARSCPCARRRPRTAGSWSQGLAGSWSWSRTKPEAGGTLWARGWMATRAA